MHGLHFFKKLSFGKKNASINCREILPPPFKSQLCSDVRGKNPRKGGAVISLANRIAILMWFYWEPHIRVFYTCWDNIMKLVSMHGNYNTRYKSLVCDNCLKTTCTFSSASGTAVQLNFNIDYWRELSRL